MSSSTRCRFVAAVVATSGVLMLTAVLPVTPQPATQQGKVFLTSGTGGEDALGNGTALVMGGTSIPQPNQLYLDAVDKLYLQPLGFGGELQPLFTPENISSTSQVRGEQILDATILQKINDGNVSAENPVVVFGYSQSAAISSAVMRQLAGQDVPSDTCISY